MKDQAHRFVPQRSYIGIALPGYAVPDALRVVAVDWVALVGRETRIGLEVGIKRLYPQIAAVGIGVDAQGGALEDKLAGNNSALLIGRF